MLSGKRRKCANDLARSPASTLGNAGGVAGTRGAIEIGEFSLGLTRDDQNARAGSILNAAPSFAVLRFIVSAAGVLASLGLHLLLLGAVIWAGTSPLSPSRQPLVIDYARRAIADEIALELVEIHQNVTVDSVRVDIPVLSAQQLSPIRIATTAPVLAVDFPQQTPLVASTPSEAGSDFNEQLQDGYMRQISARIDRVWLRPRAPIRDERFACQVRIEQDRGGNVTEVALERCNGPPRWQLSLIQAIESASPLPAPPDPSVFAHSIHMSFEAVPIDLAVSREQYEPGS